MDQANFVHLHCHTEYSLLDGANKVDKMFERIKALNLFVDDVYHDQKIIKDGVIPPHMIQSAQSLRPCGMPPT